LLLMGPFGHMGLAIATAISGLLAAVIMMLLLAAAGKISRAMLSPLVRILLASGVMAVLLWFLRPVVADMASVVRLLILVVAGGGTYFAATALFGAVPVDLLRRR
jgi:putative peptidoglycan lipid II flippase